MENKLIVSTEHRRDRTRRKKLCEFEIIALDTRIPARVKKRTGRALYDVLTEENHLWRRHAKQMRTGAQDCVPCRENDYSGLPFPEEYRRKGSAEARTINDADRAAEDRGAAPVQPPPTTLTRLDRQRQPPRRLQVDPRMKTYDERSS